MTIRLIVLMSILNHTGFGGSRVVVALYALDLGASQFSIGMLTALYALCPMLLAVHSGRLVDRLGPRLPMLVGSVAMAVGLLLPPLLPGLPVLYVSAFVLGAAFQLFFVAVQGTTGAVGGPERRAANYALLSLGFSISGFSGPLIAGFSIDHLGHLPAYLVLAAVTVPPILILWLKGGMLPGSVARPAGEQEKEKSAFDLLRVAQLRNTFIAGGFLAAAWDLFSFYFPIYGHSLGLSASAIGINLAVFGLATFVIRLALPRMVKRWSEAEIITYAIFVAALAYVLFPFFQNAYLLAATSFLLGLGLGCGQPLSMMLIYNLAPPGRAAEAAGLRIMLNNVAHVGIPLFFGGIGSAFGFAPVFLSNAALLLAGGCFSRKTHTRAAS